MAKKKKRKTASKPQKVINDTLKNCYIGVLAVFAATFVLTFKELTKLGVIVVLLFVLFFIVGFGLFVWSHYGKKQKLKSKISMVLLIILAFLLVIYFISLVINNYEWIFDFDIKPKSIPRK